MDSPVVKATLGERERCLALIRSRRDWKPSDISELIRWIESGCDEDTPPLPQMGEPWRDLPDNLVDQLWQEVETEANVARDPSWLSDDRINRVKEGYGEELAPAEVLAALGELRVLRRYVAELESDRDKFAVIRELMNAPLYPRRNP